MSGKHRECISSFLSQYVQENEDLVCRSCYMSESPGLFFKIESLRIMKVQLNQNYYEDYLGIILKKIPQNFGILLFQVL